MNLLQFKRKRLKRTLENVYENVPLYRKKFDTAGVSPSDFKHLDDLKRFPFTTKQDLRENYPFAARKLLSLDVRRRITLGNQPLLRGLARLSST
jgi:phenylacetate-coenzyme A ligase PaaK-like adenylate-forming protein